MNIFDVLYARQTGKARPRAKITDNLLGLALAGGGYEEKTIDFTPVISVADAKAGNALDYQCKITAKQTGTPSPQNICPIDGWTGAQITRAGKNLFLTTASSKEENGIIYTVNADGTISVSGTASGFSSIYCGDADIEGIHGKVTVSGIATATNMVWSGIRLYDANNVQLYDTGASSAPSITIDLANYPTAVKLTIVIKRQNNVATSGVIKPQVEGGDTAHDFVQYETPTVYTDTWQSEAGIVYGGVRNVTTGTLTVTHASIDMGDMNYSYSSDTLRFTNTILAGIVKKPSSNDDIVPLICEAYKADRYNWQEDLTVAFGTSGLLAVRNRNYTTPYSFKQSVRGVLLVYPLAEPITYTLTPTEITLAEGANTLWSDTGDSKLTYLAKK